MVVNIALPQGDKDWCFHWKCTLPNRNWVVLLTNVVPSYRKFCIYCSSNG